MIIELTATGGPESEERFTVWVNGRSAGELQMKLDEALRFYRVIFGRNYKVTLTKNEQSHRNLKTEGVAVISRQIPNKQDRGGSQSPARTAQN